jgi:hypothetical protein
MSPGRLWVPIVLGPLAWLVYLQTAYALVPLACRRPTAGTIALPLTAVVALALSAAALVAAWRAWRGSAREPTPVASGPAARTRFMVLAGIGTSAMFVLVVVAGIIPLFFLGPCE